MVIMRVSMEDEVLCDRMMMMMVMISNCMMWGLLRDWVRQM